MGVYLDASVIVPLLVPEAASPVVGVLLSSDATFEVSDLAVAEVASALSRLVRVTGYPPALAQRRLDDFDAWRAARAAVVTLEASDLTAAIVLVRRFELMLRAPDALHLVVVRRVGATLATLDVRMARVAQDLGLPLASLPV